MSRSPDRRASCVLAVLMSTAHPGGAVAGAPPALRIDPAESVLTFTIHRPGETIEGRAHDFSGEIRLDPVHPALGPSVTLNVRAASLETGNRIRDRKMRNSHLEVDRFPEIVFRSGSVRWSESSGGEPEGRLAAGEVRKALVEGLLALHGIERTILVPVSIRYDGRSVTAEGTTDLRLTDHRIPIPRFLWLVVDDEVKVRFRFVAGARAQGS